MASSGGHFPFKTGSAGVWNYLYYLTCPGGHKYASVPLLPLQLFWPSDDADPLNAGAALIRSNEQERL